MIRSVSAAILLWLLLTTQAIASSVPVGQMPMVTPGDQDSIILQKQGETVWSRTKPLWLFDYVWGKINGNVFTPSSADCSASVSAELQAFINTRSTVILRGGDCLLLGTQVTYNPVATGVKKTIRTDGNGPVTIRHPSGERALVFDNTVNASASVAVTGIATVVDNTDDIVSEISFAALPAGAARQKAGVIYSNNISTGDEGYYVIAITKANPAHVTLRGTVRAASNIANGASIRIEYAQGMTEINAAGANNCTVANLATVSGNTEFDCSNINATAYGTYTGGAYAAKEYGYWGEGFQVMEADASPARIRTYGRLDFASKYTTNPRVRILDDTNVLTIQGPIVFEASGNIYDPLITDREEALVIKGFVRPHVEDIVFARPWAQGLWLQANAFGTYKDIRVSAGPDLTSSGAYTYGVYIYGLEFAATLDGIVIEQERHGISTGDDSNGNAFNDANWSGYGYNKNATIVSLVCRGPDGSCLDSHAATARMKVLKLVCNDNARGPEGGTVGGSCMTNRGYMGTYGEIIAQGGSFGVKLMDIDHQFPNLTVIDTLVARNLGVDGGATSTAGVGLNLSAYAGSFNPARNRVNTLIVDDVGTGILAEQGTKLDLGDYKASRIDSTADIYAGASILFTGNHTYDYRDNTRAATNYANLLRSGATYGGPTVIYAHAPTIIKGTVANAPSQLFEERDTAATKYRYAPGLVEYNPSAVTPTLMDEAGATTFAEPPGFTDRSYRAVNNETLWLAAAAGNSFAAGEIGVVTATGVVKADADAESTTKGLLVLAPAAVAAGAKGEFVVRGAYTTTGLTAGATYYVSQTAGAVTATAPSTTGTQVRPVGYALNATELYVDPDKTYVEVP